MSKKNNRYAVIRYITDVPIVGLSYLLASSISLKTNIWDNSWQTYLLVFVSIAVWYISTSFSHLYKDRRSNKYSEEIIFIIYSLAIYMIVLSSAFFFLNNLIDIDHTTQFFLLFLSILFVSITLTKYILRKYLHSAIFHGKLLDNILIVGYTPAAQDFYETINRYYYYGYKCIGFLDNKTTKMNGCPYKGPIQNLESVIKELHVDEVVIALPTHQNKAIQECIEVCDQYSTQTRILPDFEQYTSSNLQVNNIGLLSVINIRELPLDKEVNRLGKRAFDIAFSILFFILIASWLFPILVLIIKLSSKGPVFFKQERWGLNNEKITCYKFRTMVAESQDIDSDGNYQQASKDDPRITTIGAFLRRTNLDELPQFWNVLIGNMSVVGPRPHPTPLNLASMHTIDNYMLRHVVKPGISGWAQVNGYRGETKLPGTMQKRVNFDLYYIHRWTFWFDCQIILQTLINMIRGDQNAY
ncbi:MAG TPA: undecaprenyl-phosphate glucose phosphotransferase [Sediminibacterium sp.]|uniref:undecaprenyl-phosphate glucose phosphotransferase n=1 Tax=Sediminibacterium sp. TaxID=1917865 RepID=UPI002B7744F7|nr:undecaprenyl-phosphate glucose phosphotransferase [Sediminibacterium sp.]HQS35911.1 undecaprenyl-phosphate glucose phosphotransferase [Sediminibacterium sp.]